MEQNIYESFGIIIVCIYLITLNNKKNNNIKIRNRTILMYLFLFLIIYNYSPFTSIFVIPFSFLMYEKDIIH